MKKEFVFNSGCLADDLKTQLSEQNIKCSETTIDKFEKIKFAIQMLHVHSYITDAQRDKCFKKFMKDLSQKLTEVQE